MSESRDREVWPIGATLAVALTVFLPFVRGVIAGHSFYFRDLAGHFFPLRLFVVEGLLQGELRFWNPYSHEGVPLGVLPLGYPLDLFQVLLPHPAGLSLLLALHVPLAAVAFVALARGLRLSVTAAAGGGLVYALGGFALSTLNLYVYLQALAWAPLVVLGLVRASSGTRRDVAAAAVLLAIALSTTGIEIVLQAMIFGVVMGWPASRPGWLRLAAAILLGVCLSAAVLLPTAALVEGSARGAGFPTDVVLAHSVHPVTLLQTLVAGLYGDLANLADRFWGENFFPRGFPYVLSLYLGAVVLALAAIGTADRRRFSLRLAVLGGLATLACLGRWVGLDPLVEMLPPLHKLRYPTKAFFGVHLACALLASMGLQALVEERRRAWPRLILLTGLAGTLLVAAGGALPEFHSPLLARFFPPGQTPAQTADAVHWIAGDATRSGLLALGVAALGLLVRAGRLPAPRATLAIVGLAAGDLLRAGAGLNAMVSPSFFSLSAPTAALVKAIRQEGGRVFTLDPSVSPAYFQARATRPGGHEVWTFRTLQEMLTPEFNVAARVATALSLDRTMLVPVGRVLPPSDASPAAVPALVDRLRRAGVSRVLSLEPIDSPGLEPVAFESPPELVPLVVHVYRLRGSFPLRHVTDPPPERPSAEASAPAGRIVGAAERSDRIELEVRAERAALVVIRDAWAPGWSGRVNEAAATILKVDGLHRGIAVAAGSSRVVLEYSPPGLAPGLWITGGAALLAAWLGRPLRREAALGDQPGR